MQIRRKMSAQNVMASISRTLAHRRESKALANEVRFAVDRSKDKLYEPKEKKKVFRVLTVIAYIISVSLAAIILSLYYTFIWDPKDNIKLQPKNQKSNPLITALCANDTPPVNKMPLEFNGPDINFATINSTEIEGGMFINTIDRNSTIQRSKILKILMGDNSKRNKTMEASSNFTHNFNKDLYTSETEIMFSKGLF